MRLITRLAAGVALTLGLLGFSAGAATADEPSPPVTPSTQLAETGAGDRALLGLGAVGVGFLVVGTIVFAVTARDPRSR